MTKTPQRSLPDDEKEPVIHRIFQLIEKRYSSRSEAANAWGMNVNTLGNYYKRAEQNPVPRNQQLQKIAECEGVSLEWLLTGEGDGPKEPLKTNLNNIDLQLMSMLSFLTLSEKQNLIEVLARKGVETALYLLDEDNIELLRLDNVVKEKILGKRATKNLSEANTIDDEARERVSHDASQDKLTPNLKQDKKQAV